MKSIIKKITPDTASEMLKSNTNNRPANPMHVARLAREITNGNWKVNGDTICIASDGRIIDGQHRLMAVVRAGIGIETFVVEGLDYDTFNTKDIGKRRSSADTLAVCGEKQCKALAAALIVVGRYLTGRMDRRVAYTNMEVENLLEEHPDIRRSVRFCKETKRLIAQSTLTGAHYLFSRKSEEQADSFVTQTISGIGLNEGDPIYYLRERLLINSISKAKLPADYIMALTIKAWNARRQNKTIQSLAFRAEGPSAESFPVIV